MSQDHTVQDMMAGPHNRSETLLSRIVFAGVRRALRDLDYGSVSLQLPNGQTRSFGAIGSGPHVDFTMHNHGMFWKSLRRGTIGFAESYINGDWETSDLHDVFRFFVAHKQKLKKSGRGFFRVRIPDRLYHVSRRNTRTGSRRNIADHYDLGNRFYRLWLDETMTYSSARYDLDDRSLEAAQAAKYARILDLAHIQAGQHVLEIGSGWGAFAETAARDRGARVTGLSLSREQVLEARDRVRRAGLAEAAKFRLMDYRDVDGRYDAIVSIEMIEAVGEENWSTYFTRLHDLLKPGGRAVIQAITISDALYPTYRRSPDFIQRYIFPGGMLPTVGVIHEHAKAAGLSVAGEERFGPSYAQTLAEWGRRFTATWPAARAMGFDERFRRMWHYYLTYCEVGFETGTIDVGMYTLQKPA